MTYGENKQAVFKVHVKDWKFENINAPTYVDFVNFPQVKMILDCIFHNMHHIHNIEVITTSANDEALNSQKFGEKTGMLSQQ